MTVEAQLQCCAQAGPAPRRFPTINGTHLHHKRATPPPGQTLRQFHPFNIPDHQSRLPTHSTPPTSRVSPGTHPVRPPLPSKRRAQAQAPARRRSAIRAIPHPIRITTLSRTTIRQQKNPQTADERPWKPLRQGPSRPCQHRRQPRRHHSSPTPRTLQQPPIVHRSRRRPSRASRRAFSPASSVSTARSNATGAFPAQIASRYVRCPPAAPAGRETWPDAR